MYQTELDGKAHCQLHALDPPSPGEGEVSRSLSMPERLVSSLKADRDSPGYLQHSSLLDPYNNAVNQDRQN